MSEPGDDVVTATFTHQLLDFVDIGDAQSALKFLQDLRLKHLFEVDRLNMEIRGVEWWLSKRVPEEDKSP